MPNSTSPYDSIFYEYQREGALRSARIMLPVLHRMLSIKSVLDVGCGAGAWLRAHQDNGVSDIVGVDGDYVDSNMLLIEPARLLAMDITTPLDLGRQFDLVQCLEVAEHVSKAAAEILIGNLIRHGRFILFSAAVPGQGGAEHINERPLCYWRGLFARRGFHVFDPLRPAVANNPDIDWWYRYNTLLYVHESQLATLPHATKATEIPADQAIRDLSPLAMKIRKLLLRALPSNIVSAMAKFKHRQFVRALERH